MLQLLMGLFELAIPVFENSLVTCSLISDGDNVSHLVVFGLVSCDADFVDHPDNDNISVFSPNSQQYAQLTLL